MDGPVGSLPRKKVIDPMRLRRPTVSLFLLCLVFVGIAAGVERVWAQAESLSRPGSMKTVLRGTSVEEFPVEILGRYGDEDLILIRISEELAERSGGIAEGMSGSPVYAEGELIGALSYALNDRSHRYALVTPIEQMLEILALLPEQQLPEDTVGLEPLMAPVFTYGYTTRSVRALEDIFSLRPLGSLRGLSAGSDVVAELEPGSAVAVQLVYGDVSVVAVGTVTWVEDGVFLAFGHPFYHAGSVSLLLSQAVVVDTVDADPLPFKLAYPTRPAGTVLQDRSAGIAGTLGIVPEYTEVVLDIEDTSTGKREQLKFYAVYDENLITYLFGSSALALVDRALDRVGTGTALVDFTIESRDLVQPLIRTNVYCSGDIGATAVTELSEAVSLLATNEFRPVHLERISARITVSDKLQRASLVQVVARQEYYSPGDEVVLEIVLRPFREAVQKYEVVLEVPDHWPMGMTTVLVESGSADFYYPDYSALAQEMVWTEAVRTPGLDEESADAGDLDLLIRQFTERLRNDQIKVTLMNMESEERVERVIDLPFVAIGTVLCDLQIVPGKESWEEESTESVQTSPEGDEFVSDHEQELS